MLIRCKISLGSIRNTHPYFCSERKVFGSEDYSREYYYVLLWFAFDCYNKHHDQNQLGVGCRFISPSAYRKEDGAGGQGRN